MALSNDEKSKILTNDEKALDQSYKSPITFMGKKCYLGHTNDIMLTKLKLLLAEFGKLDEVKSFEELEKIESKLQSSVKSIVGKIIDGLEESDFEDIGRFDIQDIIIEIGARQMRRMGLSKEQIDKAIEKDKKQIKKMVLDELNGEGESEDFPEEKTQNKE